MSEGFCSELLKNLYIKLSKVLHPEKFYQAITLPFKYLPNTIFWLWCIQKCIVLIFKIIVFSYHWNEKQLGAQWFTRNWIFVLISSYVQLFRLVVVSSVTNIWTYECIFFKLLNCTTIILNLTQLLYHLYAMILSAIQIFRWYIYQNVFNSNLKNCITFWL